MFTIPCSRASHWFTMDTRALDSSSRARSYTPRSTAWAMSSSAGATMSSDVTANIRNTLARSVRPLMGRLPVWFAFAAGVH